MDNYGTSKAADNPFLKENMRLIMAQQKHDIIYFCSGHGTHQSPQEYEDNTEKLVQWLLEDYPEKKLIIAGRIYSSYPPKEESCRQRNESLRRIAQRHDLAFDDLHALTLDRPDLLKEDKVHLNEAGQKVVAEHVAALILELTE